MKKIFITIVFFLITARIFSQAPLAKQWDYRFGGSLTERLSIIQQTKDGGYLLGGSTTSDSAGDVSQPNWGGSNTWDYWIVKVDSFGIKQWDKRFGGSDNDILFSFDQTSDNGYILGGYSGSDSSGNKSQESRGMDDYWIIKIDSLGNKLWDKRFGGNFRDELHEVKQTADGGYILGGFTMSDQGFDVSQAGTGFGDRDFWLVKVDSLGVKKWDKRFGGSSWDLMYSLDLTSDGGFIFGGPSNSDSSATKSQNTWNGSYDYWIVKTDSLGNKKWDKVFGGTLNENLYSIKETPDHGFALAGNSESSVSGDKSQPTWGLYDYWLVKIDSVGTKLWDKDYGGALDEDEFGNMELTNDGGYILAGTSYSYISGDKSESNLGNEQTWIIKVDSSGIKQWDKTLMTNSAPDDEMGLALQNNEGCYLCGNFTNANPGGDKTQPTWGATDYWIIKYCDSITALQPPVIALMSSDTTFCEKNCLNFFDLSTNNPAGWQWSFPGAIPSSSSLQNPTNICYNTYGTYDVTLIACNGAGCDTLTITNFIHVMPNPVDTIFQIGSVLYSLPASNYQWYEVTSGLIPGATGQFYITTQPGSYYCIVTDSMGCVATSDIITVSAIQSEINNQHFTIFPNPSDGSFQIDFGAFKIQHLTFRIFDAFGRVVFESSIENPASELVLRPPSLSDGIYYLEISDGEKTFRKKVVVEK